MKRFFTAKNLSRLGIWTALTLIATAFLSIPNGIGYTNLGDTVIYLAAYIYSPVFAIICGSLGSMLGDVVLGYANYAPFTLIIKITEAAIAGYTVKLFSKRLNIFLSMIISSAIGGIGMALGYFIANTILYGATSGLAALPNDALQALLSVIISSAFIIPLSKIKVIREAETNSVISFFYNNRYYMKTLAVINDLSGFGNCSMVANIAVLSAFGQEVHPLPTTVLSNQTEYETYTQINLNDVINRISTSWTKIGFPEYIYTGYLTDSKMINDVLSLVNNTNAKLFVDPILGSDGKFYPAFSQKELKEYKTLIRRAEIITPNLTEACFLSGTDYNTIAEIRAKDALLIKTAAIGKSLLKDDTKYVIITGVKFDNKIYTVYVDKKKSKIFSGKYYNSYSGTGDIFSSYVVGYYLKHGNVINGTKNAVEFLNKVVKDTFKQNYDNTSGTCFAKYLNKIK